MCCVLITIESRVQIWPLKLKHAPPPLTLWLYLLDVVKRGSVAFD